MVRNLQLCVLTLVATFALLQMNTAQAAIEFVDAFRTAVFSQTGDGNSLSTTGYYFAADLHSTDPNEFSTVQLSFPGPVSPVNLTVGLDPLTSNYGSAFYATQADMDTDFPTGVYQFDATNGSGTLTTTYTYSADDYPGSLPYLTGTNYSDLQGMNPALPFAFQFSPYDTSSNPSFSFIFLTIYDFTTNNYVYLDTFASSTTTGVTLPGNTLAFGHDYAYELIFSNRDTIPSPGANFDAQLGFDYRTQGTFSTQEVAPVPEPASLILFAGSALCMFGLSRQRRRAS